MAIKPEFTDEVIRFSTEVYDWVDNELQGGIWWERFAALTDAEKAGFFAALSDAFGDSTDE